MNTKTIGQYLGATIDESHLHLRQFLEVDSNFKILGFTDDAFWLRLFPYSLRNVAKCLLNSLEPNFIFTWKDLAGKNLAKYFPLIKKYKMRNKITSFRQWKHESLFDARERFKELLRQWPYQCIPMCVQVETFYNGIVPLSRNMLDTSSGGAMLSKSYQEGYDLIESISAITYQ